MNTRESRKHGKEGHWEEGRVEIPLETQGRPRRHGENAGKQAGRFLGPCSPVWSAVMWEQTLEGPEINTPLGINGAKVWSSDPSYVREKAFLTHLENKSDRRTYTPSLLHSWCRGSPPSQCSVPGWPKYKVQHILWVKEAQTALGFQDHRLIFFFKEEKDRGKKTFTRCFLTTKKGKKLQGRESQPRFPLKKHWRCLLGTCLIGKQLKSKKQRKKTSEPSAPTPQNPPLLVNLTT